MTALQRKTDDDTAIRFQINNNQFFILNHDNSALIFTMQKNYIFGM